MARLAGVVLALVLVPAAAAAAEPGARVSFAGSPAGVVLQRRTVAAETGYGGQVLAYKDVCSSPCEVALPAGTQELALREPGGDTVPAAPVVIPAGSASVTGEYRSRRTLRIVGWSIAGLGTAGGVALMLSDRGDTGARTYAGIGVLVAGLVAGGVLASRPDAATIRVGPGASGRAGPDRHAGPLADSLTGAAAPVIPCFRITMILDI